MSTLILVLTLFSLAVSLAQQLYALAARGGLLVTPTQVDAIRTMRVQLGDRKMAIAGGLFVMLSWAVTIICAFLTFHLLPAAVATLAFGALGVNLVLGAVAVAQLWRASGLLQAERPISTFTMRTVPA